MQGLCIDLLCIVALTLSKQQEHGRHNFFVLYHHKRLSELVTVSGDTPPPLVLRG